MLFSYNVSNEVFIVSCLLLALSMLINELPVNFTRIAAIVVEAVSLESLIGRRAEYRMKLENNVGFEEETLRIHLKKSVNG